MIIKFENMGTWNVFDEIDSLTYSVIKGGDIAPPKPEGLIDYTDRAISIKEADFYRVFMQFMNKNQTEPTYMMCFGPVYLMNNYGKTIETI